MLKHVARSRRNEFEAHIAKAANAAEGQQKHEAYVKSDGSHVSYFADPVHTDKFKEALLAAEELISGRGKKPRISITETEPRAMNEKQLTPELRALMKRGLYYIVEVKHAPQAKYFKNKEAKQIRLMLDYLHSKLRQHSVQVKQVAQ